MARWILLLLASLLVSILVIGCVPVLPEETEDEVEYYDVVVDYNDFGNFFAYEEANGNMYTSFEAYEEDLPRLQHVAENQGKELRIVTGENISAELNGYQEDYSSQNIEYQPQGLKVTVGFYTMTADCSADGHVPGCFGRRMPHCNLRLNRSGKSPQGKEVLFDLHIGGWYDENEGYCFGLYDSGTSGLINSCPCTSDAVQAYEDLREGIRNIFLRAGASPVTAAILSRTATPYIVVAGAAVGVVLVATPIPP